MGECTEVTNKITFINIFLLNGPGREASFVPEQSGYLCHRRKPAQVDSSLLFDFYRSGKILFLFWFDSDVVIDVLRLVTTQNGLGEFFFLSLSDFPSLYQHSWRQWKRRRKKVEIGKANCYKSDAMAAACYRLMNQNIPSNTTLIDFIISQNMMPWRRLIFCSAIRMIRSQLASTAAM